MCDGIGIGSVACRVNQGSKMEQVLVSLRHWPEDLNVVPEPHVLSPPVGPRQPDDPYQRHQREDALKRSLADDTDNFPAQRGAGNKKMNSVKKHRRRN